MPKNNPQTPEEKAYQEAVEKIAGHISNLARAVGALIKGPLNRKALLVLLASSSGEPMVRVEAVLKALESLEKDWLNK